MRGSVLWAASSALIALLQGAAASPTPPSVSGLEGSIGNGSSVHHDIRRRMNQIDTGLHVDYGTCRRSEVKLTRAYRAVAGLEALATAGYHSLHPEITSQYSLPSTLFFRVDEFDAVRAIFKRVLENTNRLDQAFRMPVRCSYSEHLCYPPGEPERLVYSAWGALFLCPRFFSVPDLQQPCPSVPLAGGEPTLTTDGVLGIGSTSNALILLHHYLIAMTKGVIKSNHIGTRASKALLYTPDHDPFYSSVQNADNYARLAAWAYDLGLQKVTSYFDGTKEVWFPEHACFDKFDPDDNSAAGEIPSGTPLLRQIYAWYLTQDRRKIWTGGRWGLTPPP